MFKGWACPPTQKVEFEQNIRREVDIYVESIRSTLAEINRTIHDHPETAWQEHSAHDTICKAFESLGFEVTRHAYGLATAFEVCWGTGQSTINFNAEYDALPDIGHACGHNLITTAALTGFLATVHILRVYNLPGRVQCLGTPAEELGGGKILLLEAGAYEDVLASLMVHPYSEAGIESEHPGCVSVAGMASLAVADIDATFTGRTAHAAANPWDGVNALDAVVASYNNISMLRQHIYPEEKIHGCITESPKISNAVPAHTKRDRVTHQELEEKVNKCLRAGALATGCTLKSVTAPIFAELAINDILCSIFQKKMQYYGHQTAHKMERPGKASTDQGNVSQKVPALHALVGIPSPSGTCIHQESFAKAAGSSEGFERILDAGKAMALAGLELLKNPSLLSPC